MSRGAFLRFALLVGAAAAAVGLAFAIVPRAEGSPQRAAWKALYHRPAGIPFPDDDPYSKAKDDLGRMLFFDPILSGARSR
jgi:cytochrome c peroxidase